MKSIFVFTLIISSFFSFAQDVEIDYKFNPGYIITNDGEKIAGEVKYASHTPYYFTDFIKFKTGKKAKKYFAKDIKAFKSGDHHFESHKISGKDELVFLEKLTTGCLNMYYYETHRSINYKFDLPEVYLIRSGEAEFFELNMSNFYTNFNNGMSSPTQGSAVTNKEFRSNMKELANYLNHPTLSSELRSYHKRKEFMGIEKVVDRYNRSCNQDGE